MILRIDPFWSYSLDLNPDNPRVIYDPTCEGEELWAVMAVSRYEAQFRAINNGLSAKTACEVTLGDFGLAHAMPEWHEPLG